MRHCQKSQPLVFIITLCTRKVCGNTFYISSKIQPAFPANQFQPVKFCFSCINSKIKQYHYHQAIKFEEHKWNKTFLLACMSIKKKIVNREYWKVISLTKKMKWNSCLIRFWEVGWAKSFSTPALYYRENKAAVTNQQLNPLPNGISMCLCTQIYFFSKSVSLSFLLKFWCFTIFKRNNISG